MPGFTAGSSVYKTRMHYRLGVGASGALHSHISDVFVTPAVCKATKACPDPCCIDGVLHGCCVGGTVCKDSKGNCTECCHPPGRCCNGNCIQPGENPCPAGQLCCTKGCVDVSTDPEHCGDCSTKCRQYQQCVNGQCCYPRSVIAEVAIILCIGTLGVGCETIYEQLLQEACP
jgi:hypothetical protein